MYLRKNLWTNKLFTCLCDLRMDGQALLLDVKFLDGNGDGGLRTGSWVDEVAYRLPSIMRASENGSSLFLECDKRFIYFGRRCCNEISFSGFFRVERVHSCLENPLMVFIGSAAFKEAFPKIFCNLAQCHGSVSIVVHPFSSDWFWKTLILTANGCNLCAQCGGKKRRVTWFCRAFKLFSRFFVCDEWPSIPTATNIYNYTPTRILAVHHPLSPSSCTSITILVVVFSMRCRPVPVNTFVFFYETVDTLVSNILRFLNLFGAVKLIHIWFVKGTLSSPWSGF